jgi:hypothetical protein
MTKNILMITLVIGVIGWFSGVSGSGEAVFLNMEVSLKKGSRGDPLVHVKLTNQQTASVSILDIELPWLVPTQFLLIPEGRRLDPTNSTMRRGGPFADYAGVEHHLNTGESIEGDIILGELFPTLVDDIRRYGVRIKWKCQSKALHLTCKQGKGGTFLIPKGGLP